MKSTRGRKEVFQAEAATADAFSANLTKQMEDSWIPATTYPRG